MPTNEHARLETSNGEHTPMLQSVRMSGDLHGPLLQLSLEQTFLNDTDQHLEVVYTFPLPAGAVLVGVDVVLGERRLTGNVVARKQSQQRYEEALADGDAAILLERNHDDSFSMNLGNLAARETCRVTLRYGQALRFEHGGLRLLVPTTIAPRYGDPVTQGGLQPHQVPEHSLTAEYPFTLALRLHGALAGARVASPSHPIAVAHSTIESDNTLTVTLARRAFLDRDFVLVIDGLPTASVASMGQDMVTPGHVAVLASFCPDFPEATAGPLALKILVDCSGSMAGDSIEAARRALHGIVAGLEDGDRFSLSRFGSSVEHRSRGLWKATDPTRTAAGRWVSALQADLGGTEMEGALASTFELAQDGGSDVMLVTDGEINGIDGVINAARASGHRVFVVGIGSSSVETHLRRLAQATGGACDFVAPGEAVEPAVLRMFARMRTPHVTGVAVRWPGNATPLWACAIDAAVFAADTVHVFGLFATAPSGEVLLTGSLSASAAPVEIGRVALPAVVTTDVTLSRMAAASRIATIPAPSQRHAAHPATDLALAYQLVTEFTNFLLVHERAADEKAADMPELVKVRQMTAAGRAGVGSVIRSLASMDHDIALVSNLIDRPMYSFPGANVWTDTEAISGLAMMSVSDVNPPSLKTSGSPPYGSRPKSSTPVACKAVPSEDSDIPAFMRRDGPNARPPGAGHTPRQRKPIDRNDRRLWASAAHYTGLTPLGVAVWVAGTPEADRPRTWQGLTNIGLGAWVVDWLELGLITQTQSTDREDRVVRAFAWLMSREEVLKALRDNGDLHEAFAAAVRRLTPTNTPVDRATLEALTVALEGMSADAWPSVVFAFA